MSRPTRTASHWGSYWVTSDGGEVTAVDPVTEDPSPSPIGDNFRGTLRGRTRIARPAVRQGWLRDGPGAPGRGSDPYVEVSWERATALIAAEIDRVRTATATAPSTAAPTAGAVPVGSTMPSPSCTGS